MDAFSIALILGTLSYSRIMIIKIGITVGIFHFFMPLIGDSIGEHILSIVPIKSTTIAGLIFLVLSIQMLISSIKDKDLKEIKYLNNYTSILIFALTVSIDSLSAGISFSVVSEHHILSALTFMITSTLFTISGLILGKRLKKQFGKYATIIGSILLLLLAIKYFI